MNKLKYTCIFGGGAVRGQCYIGAIKALKELGIEMTSFAGSSVGAVFASLYAAGYSEEEISNIFDDVNFNMFRDINLTFGGDFSLSKGEVFLSWLREKIQNKVWGDSSKNAPVRFKDLKYDLYIITTDLSTNSPYVFSKDKTPEAEVAFAVRASASMPGLMKPVELDSSCSILVDGDLTKSWPVWKTDRSICREDSRILEFRLEGSKECLNIKNPLDYFNTVYNAFSYLCTSNVISDYGQKDKFDYIVFDTKDLLLIDFNLSDSEREELIQLGYSQTMKYFKENLINKKEFLLPLYKEFFINLNDFRQAIKTGKYDISKNSVNKLIASTKDMFIYIDTSFYKDLKQISELLEKNRHKSMFSCDKINNVEVIIQAIDNLQCKLKDLISEFQDYIKKNKKNY